MVVVMVDGARLVQKSGNQLKGKQDKATAGPGLVVDNKPSCNTDCQMKKDQILIKDFKVERRG